MRTALTAVTLLAVLEAWVAVITGLSGIWDRPMSGGGCGGGAAIVLRVFEALTLLALGWVVVLTAAAVVAVVFFWIKYNLAAGFALAANLMVLLTLGVATTDPSVLWLWRIVIVVLAPAPAIGVIVILWVWAARAPTRAGKIIVPVVATVALLPFAAYSGYGFATDANSLVSSPPQIVAPVANHGCGPSRQS